MMTIDWYKPAFKGGGTITSLENLVDHTSDYVDYYIYTGDRDFRDKTRFKNVSFNSWVELAGEKVYYGSGALAYRLYRQMKIVRPDIVNVVGLFSPIFSIVPIIISRFLLKRNHYLISPHGMLQEGALNLKSRKKKLYLRLAKWFKLYKNCSFHATDDQEKLDIIEHLSIPEDQISVVSNLPKQINGELKEHTKQEGQLRIVYFSRITPKKNLHYLPPILQNVKNSKIVFDVIGPIDNPDYWDEIAGDINAIDHVTLNYHGALRQNDAFEVLKECHFMILPTTGENYGYVIIEALSLGLPVIISDKTPWSQLQQNGIGWDIGLNKPEAWTDALTTASNMGTKEYQQLSLNATAYIKKIVDADAIKQAYLDMFESVDSQLDVLIVSPFPKKRYKGGITVFTENILNHKDLLKKTHIHLTHLNTCVIPRSNEITGKMHWKNALNTALFIYNGIVAVRKHRFNCIHHHTSIRLSLIKDTLSAIVFGLFSKASVILHIHSAQTPNMFKNTRMIRLFNWLTKSRVHKIIVLGDEVKNFLIEKGMDGSKIDVLPNFYTSYKKETDVEPVAKSSLQLAYIGSIEAMKGIKDLLEALEIINHLDWKIEFAGEFLDPKFEEELKQTAFYSNNKDRISFLGYIDSAKKNAFYSKADVLILPSYSEGMPISILEGLFYGTAIITTNVGANTQYFKDIANLLEPGDVKGLALEIEKLITDNSLLLKRKEQAKTLSADYDFGRFKEKLIHIYNNL